MTTRNSDPPPLPERDPAFDAAWRAASAETPPAALDAAILAAAHRAAGAGPRRADVREATRPERWWWPLAAAATIGVVTIGILQLMPAERSAVSERAIVTDMPAGPSTANRSLAAKPAAEAAAPAAAPATPPASASDAAPVAAQSVPRSATPPAPPVTPSAPPSVAARRDEAPARQSAVAKREAGRVAGESAAAATQQAPTPAPSPAQSAAPAPAPSAPTLAAAPAAKAQADAATPQQFAQPFPGGAAAQRQASGGVSPSSGAAPSPGAALSSGAAPSAATGKVTAEADSSAHAELRKQTHPPLPVNEWIALIRKLRQDGMVRDAAKELAAFRAAHPDAERLLPPDLRDWRPPAE